MPGDERFGMLIPVLVFPYFATGIFRTWIFNNTGGSVLAAVLFHAAGNTAGWAFPANVPSQMYADLIYTGLALAVVLVFGWDHLICTKPKVPFFGTRTGHLTNELEGKFK
jgi:membrane protease YdiL (CAAX protease family)